jgi:DNA-binding CsgD family transcriptional regulator
MHHVLQQQLGVTLNRPLLTRLTLESEGNPMLAVELARAVLRLPAPPRPDEDLPVARSVQELVTNTLRSLPERTLTALRLIALLTAPTAGDLREAGVDPADLDPAEETGLIQVRGGPRFRHPLQATAVRAGIPDGLRRRLQLRLAAAVTDPDERARQLARAITDPDESVAADLEASGRRQWARGVPTLAADLLERAAALTPPGADGSGHRRMLAAVRARYDSGDHAATAASADRVAAALSGDEKAEALLVRAIVAFVTEGHQPAVRFAESALDHADPTGVVAGRIHAHLAVFDDRPETAIEHGARAQALIPEDQDPDRRGMRCSAMLMVFYNEARAGRTPRLDLLELALNSEGEQPPWLAGSVPGLWWTAVDEHERARARMHRQLAHARATGDEPLQLEVLLHLVQSLMLDGRWDSAEHHLAQARALGEQLGGGLDEQDYLQAQLGIYRGDFQRYGPIVAAGLERARREGDSWGMRVYGVLEGQLALHSGDHHRAARSFADLAAAMSAHGLVEPLALRWEPDWIEACVGAGDIELAVEVLERLATRHRRLPRPWTALGLARSRVLVLAAQGSDTTAALAGVDDALAAVPPDVLPLDRARCLLIAGVAHRRARRRGRARDHLSAALTGFEVLGANAFAARARSELQRSGVRGDGVDLTATERRVALLAAQGSTNRAIADALFISPKTVEANLARVYRKLAIASRAELGAAFGGGASDDGGEPRA